MTLVRRIRAILTHDAVVNRQFGVAALRLVIGLALLPFFSVTLAFVSFRLFGSAISTFARPEVPAAHVRPRLSLY